MVMFNEVPPGEEDDPAHELDMSPNCVATEKERGSCAAAGCHDREREESLCRSRARV
jgi:hypothetical protein